MKKKLPKNKLSVLQIICFVMIGIVCIVAILEAVYVALFSVDGTIENVSATPSSNVEVDEKELLKDNFLNIFENNLVTDVDTVSISKKDNKYDLIYSAYNKIEKNSEKYDINVQLPHINISSQEVDKINEQIDTTFKTKAESILADETLANTTIYNIKYQAYLNNNILSVIVKCTLKEGTNAQRIIVRAYNYNMETDKQVTLEELVNIKQVTQKEVENEIKNEIDSQVSMEKSLIEAGYEVFTRYPESEMYKYENINNFFIDNQNNIYIIFAYGNTNNTSEIDLVIL